jgi:putative DNA primase/helicase
MKRTAEHTDIGNMQRFVEEHGERLRYVGSWNKWLAWDGTRWRVDDRSVEERCAKETVQRMVVGASDGFNAAMRALDRANASGDDDMIQLARERLSASRPAYDWAVKSHDAPRILSLVRLAKAAPELAVSYTQLDADPWLLNVRNGTLNLKTGKLFDHRREDLISKVCAVDYLPDAHCPTWDAFVLKAMGGDEEMVGYLQRIVGYALSGDISEHALFFFFGGGANGKTTFLNTIHAALGDYGTTAPRGLLFRSRNERHPTELTTLFGARFATCSEVDDGQAFDEALLKDLTGGESITARRMREDHWTFRPTHKLFVAGNHKPHVQGNDDGVWRRIKLIPWTVTVPPGERDYRLPEKLRAELPGILAWVVRGCLRWQEVGLCEPTKVGKATSGYREESDPLGEFFSLHLQFDQTAAISRKSLREKYEEYCKEIGALPVGARRLSSRLREHGIARTTVRSGLRVDDGWKGVRLKTSDERSAVGTVVEDFGIN